MKLKKLYSIGGIDMKIKFFTILMVFCIATIAVLAIPENPDKKA